MPPFSRGATRVLFNLAKRATRSSPALSKTSRKTPTSPQPTQPQSPSAQISKPIPKAPSTKRPSKPSGRPTQLPPPPAQSSTPVHESPLHEQKLSRFDPRYGFALLRLSLIGFSKYLYRRVHQQYLRLPQPIRYTINFIYLLGVAFVLLVPPMIVFRNHFFDMVRVTGPSMSPYLNTNFEDGATDVHDIRKSTDRILLNLYRPGKNLRRGMVVAFRTPHDPEKWAIKRIVALQGDRVFPLPHYPDFDALDAKGLIVPFGHMWVEGDVSDANKKDASLDSNVYGPISIGLVMGKATHVIPSFVSRWTAVDSEHFKLPERVQPNALILQNPDDDNQSREFEEMFQNGGAAELLNVLTRKLQQAGSVEKYRQIPDMDDMFRLIRLQAKRQLAKGDPQTTEVARDLLAVSSQVLAED